MLSSTTVVGMLADVLVEMIMTLNTTIKMLDITNAEASVGNRCYLVLPRSLVSRRTPST